MRENYEATVKYLKEIGVVYEDEHPELPSKMPQYDDEEISGFNIFRTGLEDIDFSGLDMPMTFFGKSELVRCNFTSSNLAMSNLCWNDFIDVNFTGCDLSGADMRASVYENVNFTRANLAGADLRRSDFNQCVFIDANLQGALLAKVAASLMSLSSEQRSAINWQNTEGDEPNGG